MEASVRKSRAAAYSVLSNSLLVGGKLAIGLLIGSVSVISEAIHSAVDLLAALIAWFAVRMSAKPADADHPFGHGKIENLSGTIEALLILVAAVWIIFEAVAKLRHPEPVEHPGLGAAIMAVSVVANWLVSRHLFTVGRETDSVALIADAWHLRTDIWTSLGVMAALGVMALTGWLWPGAGLHWIDPVAAILVALLILHAAWELTVSAGRDLVDAALPAAELEAIRTAALGADPAVQAVAGMRARKAGAERLVEVTIAVPGSLSVDAGHAIADRVEAAVALALPRTTTMVHIEPAG
jgi:cation diffusion facilitator family transporter